MLTQPKRTALIVMRVTPEEREAIIAGAQAAGESVSNFIRAAALAHPVPDDCLYAGSITGLMCAAYGA
jgi:uncharacterized protein (DUF1778 family)